MKTIHLPFAILLAGLTCLGCTDKAADPQATSGVILAAPPAAPLQNAAVPIEDKPAVSVSTSNSEASLAGPLNAAYSQDQPQDPSVHEVPGASPMNGTLMPANAGQLKTP